MRFLCWLILGAMLFTNSAAAMTFSQPVEVGKIGFPIQSPYHGYRIIGASYNNGESYFENSELIATPVTTYIKGIARWGDGDEALYCEYDFNSNDHLKFGGKDSRSLLFDGIYKNISKIDTDNEIILYELWYQTTTTHVAIIGRQKDGKWVLYINSRKISDTYFGGNEAYKWRGGVSYGKPRYEGDTIILTYKVTPDNSDEILDIGEFRFKWDDAAQWFSVEQIIY